MGRSRAPPRGVQQWLMFRSGVYPGASPPLGRRRLSQNGPPGPLDNHQLRPHSFPYGSYFLESVVTPVLFFFRPDSTFFVSTNWKTILPLSGRSFFRSDRKLSEPMQRTRAFEHFLGVFARLAHVPLAESFMFPRWSFHDLFDLSLNAFNRFFLMKRTPHIPSSICPKAFLSRTSVSPSLRLRRQFPTSPLLFLKRKHAESPLLVFPFSHDPTIPPPPFPTNILQTIGYPFTNISLSFLW